MILLIRAPVAHKGTGSNLDQLIFADSNKKTPNRGIREIESRPRNEFLRGWIHLDLWIPVSKSLPERTILNDVPVFNRGKFDGERRFNYRWLVVLGQPPGDPIGC